jgi:hypothetical protein
MENLSVELDYVFLSLGLWVASVSGALLSVLLVCNGRILRHRGKFSNMLCHFDRSSQVRHFSDGIQIVYPLLKKLIMASHYAKTT